MLCRADFGTFQLVGLVWTAVDRFIAVGQDRVCCFLLLKGGGLYIPTQRYGPLTLILTKGMFESCM